MITDEVLKKLAKLARIEIKEKDKIISLLNSDIDKVKDVSNINTDNLEPLINPYNIILETQEDIVGDGNKQGDILKSNDNSMYNYFIVPKIIE